MDTVKSPLIAETVNKYLATVKTARSEHTARTYAKAESPAVQTLDTQVACLPDDVRYKIKFVVPGVQSLPLAPTTTSARFRIRASHEIALSAENLEHFLSIPELTKVVAVTLNSPAQR